jgi:hypothetical protein
MKLIGIYIWEREAERGIFLRKNQDLSHGRWSRRKLVNKR